MTSKHTPGPWSVEHDFMDESAFAILSDDCVVATAWGNDHVDANAHLIAAAPDMLEALRGVVDTCRADCPAGLPALSDARAALAKAEGRT